LFVLVCVFLGFLNGFVLQKNWETPGIVIGLLVGLMLRFHYLSTNKAKQV